MTLQSFAESLPFEISFRTHLHSLVDLFRAKDMGWVVLDSNGSSGGILILWNDLLFIVSNHTKGIFSPCLLISLADEFFFCLSAIYGPTKSEEKTQFWKNSEIYLVFRTEAWLLGGIPMLIDGQKKN